MTPSIRDVTIGGRTATVTGSGNTRTATYTIPADEKMLLDGELKVNIKDYQDKYFNNGIIINNTTTGGLVVYDKILPSVAITSIVSNNSNNKLAKNGNMLTLSMTFSENIGSSTVTIGGRSATITGSGNTRTATYTIPAGEASIAEGNIGINITGYRDEAGNVGSTFTSITTGGNVVYDRTSPVCTSSGGNTTWRNTNLTLTGTCSSDNLSGCGSPVTKNYTTDINSTTESPGVVYDAAGNGTTCPGNQTVRIDKTAPAISATYKKADGTTYTSDVWTNQSVTITGTGNDSTGSGVAKYQGTYDGSNVFDLAGNILTMSSSTRTGVWVRAVDNVGNIGPWTNNFVVSIDKTAPT
jgi:uncharacterized Zn-binding protein involved in type VI secretion